MWYKVKVSRNIQTPKGKDKTVIEYYLSDKQNFAEAGYAVLQYLNGEGEIEDVSDVSLGVPVVLSKKGIAMVVPIHMNSYEKEKFYEAADIVKETTDEDLSDLKED